MDDIRKNFLIYSTLITAAVVLYAQDIVTIEQILSYGSIATVPAILWWMFDSWIWSIKKISFMMPPNLNGIWQGTCKSNRDTEPHRITLKITQSFSRICVTSDSERVDSPSRLAMLESSAGNSWHLIYSWGGLFKIEAPQSGQVYGLTTLMLCDNQNELRGEYISKGKELTHGIISVTRKA